MTKTDFMILKKSESRYQNKSTINEYKDIAYSFLAPILTQYIIWINKVATERQVSGILFSSRDGWLLKQMYERLNANNREVIPSFYFYTSRKVAMISGMRSDADFDYLIRLPYADNPENVLEQMFHLSKDNICEYRDQDLREYYSTHREFIENESDNQRNNYKKYISNLGLKKDVKYAFVDFVASGTVLNFLQNIIDFDVVPIYICRYGNNEKYPYESCSMIVTDRLDDNSLYFTKNYTFFETVMTSLEPSVKAFDKDGNPIFADEVRTLAELEYVAKMQEGILEFFDDFLKEYNHTEDISLKLVDELYSRISGRVIPIECEFLNTLMIHQDLGFREIKALKEEIKISVVLTTYNRRYEIRRALEDVYKQTKKPFEIILIDDASTDGTEDYLSSFDFKNLIYIRNEERKGPGCSRNIGIAKSSGNYIAFLDSDDQWTENRLEKIYGWLQSLQDTNEAVDILCNLYKQHIELEYEILPKSNCLSGNMWLTKEELLLYGPYAASASVYSKRMLEVIGGFSEKYQTVLDWEIMVRSIVNGNARVILKQDCLTECWQMHDGMGEDRETMLEEKKKLLNEYENLFEREIVQQYKSELQEKQQELDSICYITNRKSSFYTLLSNWMTMRQNGDSIANRLKNNNINTVAIYGAGKHGEFLYQDLVKDGYKVSYYVDQKRSGQKVHDLDVYDSSSEKPSVDAIIITPYLELEEIKTNLVLPENCIIISLFDIVA